MTHAENFITLLSWVSLSISVPVVVISLWTLYWLNYTKAGRQYAWECLVKHRQYADDVLYPPLLIAAGVATAAVLWSVSA